MVGVFPEAPTLAWANRQFITRTVRAVAEQRVHQFLDIGIGLPMEPVSDADHLHDIVAMLVGALVRT